MKFSFFKKTKVENAFDPELQLVLPKSGKTISLAKLVNDAYEKDEDEAMGNKDMNSGLADMTHKVKMKDGSYCNVGELLDKHNKMCDEMEKMKKDSEEKELDLDVKEKGVDAEGDLHNDDMEEENCHKNTDEEHPEDAVHDDNDDDKDAKKKALQLAEHEEKEIEEAKNKNKKKNALEKAARLRNAHLRALENEAPVQTLELSHDRMARGKARYGS